MIIEADEVRSTEEGLGILKWKSLGLDMWDHP